MNNLDLKYIFAGCIVLFIILYFSYPEIIKSLKERFSSHNTVGACRDDCNRDPDTHGSDGTYDECFYSCRNQQHQQQQQQQ